MGVVVTDAAVMPVINARATLECEWTGSRVASMLYRIYPKEVILWLASLFIKLSNITLS